MKSTGCRDVQQAYKTQEGTIAATTLVSKVHKQVGATPKSRSNCLQTCRIHHQVKYQRLNANTYIVAAILFSGHPYIGSTTVPP